MYRKLQVVEKCADFRKATKVVTDTIPASIPDGHVLVKNHYAGVNATDVNSTLNRYGPKYEVPYSIGLEAMGVVEKVGDGVDSLVAGDAVTVYWPGGYSEYQVAPAAACLKIPSVNPTYLAANVSGLTAAVSLGELVKPRPTDTALVTAAGGGTGSIAVQLLKHKYKCRCVIGTCGTPEKEEFLKSIGCDVVINYKKSREEVTADLRAAAPDGLDVVYECVGGEIRNIALDLIATHGRMILIGGISGYRDGSMWDAPSSEKKEEDLLRDKILLRRSASVAGFLLPQFRSVIPAYFAEILGMLEVGTLKVRCDPCGAQKGLDHVAEAVDYLYTGKSWGKIIVDLS